MKNKIVISTKFVPIILFWLLLNYHRDSVFPFQLSTSQTILRIYSAVFFIALTTLFILSFKLKDQKIKLSNFQFKLGLIGIVTICLLVLEFSLFRLFKAEESLFGDKNFNNLMIFHSLLFFIALVSIFVDRSRGSGTVPSKIILIFTAIASLISLSIIWFIPNTAKLGDLMPILEKQSEATLNGESIYQYFELDNGVKTQAVRQPGMHLLYLPAVALGFDIRIINVVYFALIILILYKLLKNKVNDETLILSLSLFIFFPYRLFRVDYYDVPYILIFLLSTSLLLKLLGVKTENIKQKVEILEAQNTKHQTLNTKYLRSQTIQSVFFSVIWGVSISTQVWSWLFSPFLWLFMWKKFGFKTAFLSALASLGIALIIILPFVLPNPENYYEHVFGFYDMIQEQGIKAETSIHLAPILNVIIDAKHFTLLQIILVGIIGLSSIKFMRKFEDLTFYFGLSFFTFMSLNTLTWPYMFILIFIIMLVQNKTDHII